MPIGFSVMILGQPLIVWLGFATLISLLLTALIGFLSFKGFKKVFKIHPPMAALTIILAIIHALSFWL